MRIYCPAFEAECSIPSKYTCDGADLSIPLAWEGLPPSAKSLALIMDDPDAPGGTWVHWLLYNLPAALNALPEAFPSDPALPDGSLHGRNSWGRFGYGGPCPPSGVHRYFFKLFALDSILAVPPGFEKTQLLDRMQAHILQETSMFGLYGRISKN